MRFSRVLGTPLLLFSFLFSGTAATFAFGNGTIPLTYGIVLFRMFDVLDVFGPIEVLQYIGSKYKTDIHLIAESMDAVSSEPKMAHMNPFNSSMYPVLPPTHTLQNAPIPDVLILPGGPGMRSPEINATIEWIKQTAPKAKQVITICTGSALAARAGLLDGRKATTNKMSWPKVITFGPNTTWVPHARWVEDDSANPPIWSSSGVTAGIDLMLNFVEKTYGAENATWIENIMEFQRIKDPNTDPFARNETMKRSVW